MAQCHFTSSGSDVWQRWRERRSRCQRTGPSCPAGATCSPLRMAGSVKRPECWEWVARDDTDQVWSTASVSSPQHNKLHAQAATAVKYHIVARKTVYDAGQEQQGQRRSRILPTSNLYLGVAWTALTYNNVQSIKGGNLELILGRCSQTPWYRFNYALWKVTFKIKQWEDAFTLLQLLHKQVTDAWAIQLCSC